MRLFISISAMLFCVALSTACQAGADFVVNAYTTSNQYTPSIATDGTNYLVVWQSINQDGEDYGIFARLFDEDGTPLTYDIQVNTYTTGNQANPAIASNGSNYLVIWESYGEYSLTRAVVGQFLDSDGSKIGSPFQISDDDEAEFAKVASNGTNYYVVYAYDNTTAWRIKGRYVYSSTSMSFEETVVYLPDEYLTGLSVAGNATRYCIVTDSYKPITGSSYNEGIIRSYMKPSTGNGRRINIDSFLQIYSYTPGSTSVATDGTNFFITYPCNDFGTHPEDGEFDVCGRYINNLNQRLGPEIVLTEGMPLLQYSPAVCAIAPSSFFTAWRSYSSDSVDFDIQGVSVSGYHNNLPQRDINTFTTGDQFDPAVATNGTTIFIVWNSTDHDGSSYSVSGNIIGKEDTDGDGLNLYKELIVGTSDSDPDTDDDTLSDYDEVTTHNSDPLNEDTDNDMLRDAFEINITETDPTDADSDDDGLDDFEEILVNTDPNDDDSDDDGLNDHEEIMVYDTDPNNEDSDSDGYSDYKEVLAGTDPNDGLDFLEITRFHELSAYLGTSVAFIGWNSSPDKVYRVYVQTDAVGPEFILLEDDIESKGYETFYMDQGGGPNKIPHPDDDPNPRLYQVVLKPAP